MSFLFVLSWPFPSCPLHYPLITRLNLPLSCSLFSDSVLWVCCFNLLVLFVRHLCHVQASCFCSPNASRQVLSLVWAFRVCVMSFSFAFLHSCIFHVPTFSGNRRWRWQHCIRFNISCLAWQFSTFGPIPSICVTFIGSVYPSPDEIQKMTPLLAQRNVIWDLLNRLKDNHSGYKDVVLSCTNLDTVLPNEDPSIPTGIFISHLLSTACETESSGYTNDQDDTPQGPEIPSSANGVISESIEGLTIWENKALAIRHWKTGGGAFTVPHSSNPINEYDNPNPCFPIFFLGVVEGSRMENDRYQLLWKLM